MKNNNQNKIIANNIKKFIDQKGITQKELAKEIGITPSTVSDYMNLRSKPSHGVIQKMADFFEVGKSDIDTTYKEKMEFPEYDSENKLIEMLLADENKTLNSIASNLTNLNDDQLKIVADMVSSLVAINKKEEKDC